MELSRTSIFSSFRAACAVRKAIQPHEAVLFFVIAVIVGVCPRLKTVLRVERAFYACIGSQSVAQLCFSDDVHNAKLWILADRKGGNTHTYTHTHTHTHTRARIRKSI